MGAFQSRVLEGRNVRLEPLATDHLSGLCEVGLDPELWRLTTVNVQTRRDMEAYVESALRDAAEGSAVPYVTIEKRNGKIVGSTRFGNIDRLNKRVEIGWTWVAKPWQRTAINSEAKFLMLSEAFDDWGCIRVELKTDRLNVASQSAIARIGAKEEGILRQHMITCSGRLRDTVFFSIIDSEWPEVKLKLSAVVDGNYEV